MARTTKRQRKTEGRVMHEFQHGELKRGRGRGKVKSRKQAIAIALNEAGASNRQSPTQKRKARKKTTKKDARGTPGQQRREGRSAVGARGRKSTTKRKSATRKTAKRKTTAKRGTTRKKTTRKKATRKKTAKRSRQ